MLQKHLKLLLRSEDAWATPPERLMGSVCIGAQRALLSGSTPVVLMQVFTYFQTCS